VFPGALAERGRVLPAMLFSFCWMTLVYAPVACWVWNPSGWAFKWGVLDFAGGGPVEIGSGMGGLAYAWVLGRRHEKELLNFRPHHVSLVVLGTFMLWFGWLGFNGGSAFGANLRAITAVWNSMLMASVSGAVWCLLDWRIERKWTMVGFCSGTIAGLVAATPASGFVPTWAAVVEGVVVGAVANFATKLKFLLRVDDALDLLAEHWVGGVLGLLFNGLFATDKVIALDGVSTAIKGGFLDRNWKQLYIQFAYVCAVSAYVFVVTAAIAWAIDSVPGLHLRATMDEERIGMDDAEVRERSHFHPLDAPFPSSIASLTHLVSPLRVDRRVRDGLHRGPPRLHGLDARAGRERARAREARRGEPRRVGGDARRRRRPPRPAGRQRALKPARVPPPARERRRPAAAAANRVGKARRWGRLFCGGRSAR
jgi:ammonium transporter